VGAPTVLTSGGAGTAAYHRFGLQSTGGASVTATFDGQPIGAAWTGIALQHENIVLWGNSNQARAGRGIMAFHDVTLQIGAPAATVTGDFDGDADVDAADFLRWQRTLASVADLYADANGDRVVNGADLPYWRSGFGPPRLSAASRYAPEPPGTALLACIVAGAAMTIPRRASASASGRR
jgi:hypothetical protein